jgi:RNA polymerase sigma-70 factor (ECF subfamily)
MDQPDEHALIARAKQGDDLAYELLLATLVEPAHKLACGLLHDSHLAEDAVQDAAVKAWRKLANLKFGTPIRPWFLAIVANQCRDVRRGHWARIVAWPEMVQASHDHEQQTLDRVQVRQILERLNRDERLIMVLRFYLDLPWPEVAIVAGLSEAGARTRLYRALAKVRPLGHAAVTI